MKSRAQYFGKTVKFSPENGKIHFCASHFGVNIKVSPENRKIKSLAPYFGKTVKFLPENDKIHPSVLCFVKIHSMMIKNPTKIQQGFSKR